MDSETPGVHIRRVQTSSDTIQLRFGTRIRMLRKKQGYSQEAFAEKCGLDRTYVGGIERGERNVSLRNIAVIADALNLSVSQLMDSI